MKIFFRGFTVVVFSILLFGCMASMSPLMQAIDKDDARAVEGLLNKGADINATAQCDGNMPEFESYTPLGCAAKNGRTAAARILLDKGADINHKEGGYRFGQYNPTALILASREGHAETVKLLLERGADIKATDTMTKMSPLMWAVLAARGGHTEIVKLLLDKGADVNETRTGTGETPLICAAGNGSVEDVKILLDRGARINAKTDAGTTALSSAASNGHGNVVKVLLDSGADMDAAMVTLESRASTVKDPSEAIKYKQGIKILERYAKKQDKPDHYNTGQVSDVDRPTYKMPESSAKFAIVVGIENYSELPDASYAERDASAVRDHLIAMGFPQRNIILLKGQRATRTGIAKNLETWLPNNINQDSTVFFYYSGHGAPDPSSGEAYIVPYDGDPNYITDTGYPLARLYQKLGELKARKVTVVLDSCFSGAGGRSVLAKGARPLVMTAQSKPLAPNLVVLTATRGSQISTSSVGRGHGLLTYYYLKALNEGNTDMDEIYNFLRPKVEDEARSLNVSQSPTLQSGQKKAKEN